MPAPEGPNVPRHRPIPEILEAAGRICLERPLDYYLVAAVALLAAWTVNQIFRVLTIGGVPLGALEDPRAPEFLHALGHLLGAGVADGLVYALANSMAGAVIIVLIARRGEYSPALREGIALATPRFIPAILATLLFFLAMACIIGVGAAVAGLPVIGTMGTMGTMGATGTASGLTGSGDVDLPWLAARILVGFATLAILLVIGLGLLYLWLRWALYPQVVVLEECGPLAALQRSAALTIDQPATHWTDRYLTRAAVLTACMVLLQAVVGAIGSAPYGIGLLLSQEVDTSRTSILNPTGMPLFFLIPAEIFSVLLRAVVYPYSVAVFVLLYEDVRTHWRPLLRDDVRDDAGATR